WQAALHRRCVHPAFLKDGAVPDDARQPASAFGAFPAVAAKPRRAVCFFQPGADLFLQRLDERLHTMRQGRWPTRFVHNRTPLLPTRTSAPEATFTCLPT